jgi:hypothetical protein
MSSAHRTTVSTSRSQNMNDAKGNAAGPLGIIGFIVLIELVLAIFASQHVWWAGLALFVLVAAIQTATLLLLWYMFRLLLRVSDRVKNLQIKDAKWGASNESVQGTASPSLTEGVEETAG